MASAVSFATMKSRAEELLPGHDRVWRAGARTFPFEGRNGRWRGILGEDELAHHEEAGARLLPPDAAAWLERGRAALGGAARRRT